MVNEEFVKSGFELISRSVSSPSLTQHIDRNNLKIYGVSFDDKSKEFSNKIEAMVDKDGTNFYEPYLGAQIFQKFDSERTVGLQQTVTSVEPKTEEVLTEVTPAEVQPNLSAPVVESQVNNESLTQSVVVPNEPVENKVLESPQMVVSTPVDEVNNEVVQNPTMNVQEPVNQVTNQGPVVHIGDFNGGTQEPVQQNTNGVASIDRSYEQNAPAVEKSGPVRTLKLSSGIGGKLGNAAFVKFPVFLLTIMTIGALGIFVGKMFYTYLSQQ